MDPTTLAKTAASIHQPASGQLSFVFPPSFSVRPTLPNLPVGQSTATLAPIVEQDRDASLLHPLLCGARFRCTIRPKSFFFPIHGVMFCRASHRIECASMCCPSSEDRGTESRPVPISRFFKSTIFVKITWPAWYTATWDMACSIRGSNADLIAWQSMFVPFVGSSNSLAIEVHCFPRRIKNGSPTG
ncbi:hypothetical protein M569_06070 [Genlisea aurea]|uniref:Uncharacterized protein n=1 Tax=Genlisea aurea TaxID=192259 RepID=S8CNE2_9LAMI|nr:hypothetical protein M569_06070 [Genlisea aurea]